LKLGGRVDDLENRLISLELRTAMAGFELSSIQRELRGHAAEYIVGAKLHELGMRCRIRQKCPDCNQWNLPEHTDLIAYKPGIKNPLKMPIQVKSVSLERHGYAICVDDVPLKEFKGYYIALFEHIPWDIFLYVESSEMQELMHKSGNMQHGKVRHHKDYWELYVPRSLRGFEKYLNPEELIGAVLATPYN